MQQLTAALCAAVAATAVASSVSALPHAAINATMTQRHLEQCTPLPGDDIVGQDLSHATGVAAAADCCTRCSALAGCQAYTWTPWGGGICWFKSASQPTHANADAQSGAVARPNDDSQSQNDSNVSVPFKATEALASTASTSVAAAASAALSVALAVAAWW